MHVWHRSKQAGTFLFENLLAWSCLEKTVPKDIQTREYRLCKNDGYRPCTFVRGYGELQLHIYLNFVPTLDFNARHIMIKPDKAIWKEHIFWEKILKSKALHENFFQILDIPLLFPCPSNLSLGAAEIILRMLFSYQPRNLCSISRFFSWPMTNGFYANHFILNTNYRTRKKPLFVP